ncbi:MAG: VCBS repeat-containing protein [Pseudomonadota bacterium]
MQIRTATTHLLGLGLCLGLAGCFDDETIPCGDKGALQIFTDGGRRSDLVYLDTDGNEIATEFNVRDARRFALLAYCARARNNLNAKGASNFQVSTVGTRPADAVLADLDGNGDLDLIVANQGSNDVSILLNEAEMLGAAASFATGAGPRRVRAALFDDDLLVDLVTLNDADLSFLKGNGDGTFQAPQSITLSGTLLDLDVGRLNADDALDLVVARGDSVAVLLGQGDGTFAAATALAADSGRVARLLQADGNSDLDIATPTSLLLGNGDGTFQAAISLGADLQGTAIAPQDLNDDDLPDLVTVNNDLNIVSVRMGEGAGQFSAPQHYTTGDSPSTISFFDLNGNGVPGLVISNAQADVLTLRENTGSDSLLGARNYFASADGADGPAGLVAGHFNADSQLDFVVGQTLATAALLPGLGDGRFGPPVDLGAAGARVTSGLFNADGLTDLAIASSPFGGSRVSVLISNGDGTFGAPTQLAVNDSDRIDDALLAVSVNTNEDDHVDLVVANSGDGTVDVWRGDGLGGFQSPVTTAVGIGPAGLAIADFDGDQIPDLAVANRGQLGALDGSLSLALGVGDGSFEPPTTLFPGSSVQNVAAATMDANATQDLVIIIEQTQFSPELLVLPGQGDGTFGASLAAPPPDDFFPSGQLLLADADEDGDIDVAAVISDSRTGVFENDGTGQLLPAQLADTGARPNTGVVGDFNSDGAIDVAVTAGGGVTVFLDPNADIFADSFEARAD